MSTYFYVTISREYGSGGREIAIRMSELLGIPCYDREIVENAAEKLHLSVSEIDNNEETAKKSKSYHPFSFSAAVPAVSGTTKEQDEIFKAQSDVIYDLARNGSAIFVGRCADFVLADEANVVNIFIYAPFDLRVDYIKQRDGMTVKAAEKLVDEIDTSRDEYRRQFTGYNCYDPKFRDIMIDSSFLGVEQTAVVLADMIKKKYM